MFDVVPPNAEEFDREEGLGPPRRRGVVKGKRQGGWRERKYGGGDLDKRTVEVEWKLPARLRKPVREQLQKERSERARRREVITFDRRPIRTRAVGEGVSRESREADNRGAERHMGDTYRNSKPNVIVAVPPYKGRALKRRLDGKPARPKTDAFRTRLGKPASGKSVAVKKKVAVRAAGGGRQKGQAWTQGERDVPFDWRGREAVLSEGGPVRQEAAREAAPVKESKVSFPFSLSLWPKSLVQGFGKKKITTRGQKANLALLVLGLGAAWGLVWNLQGAGRGLAVLGSVQERAMLAVQELVEAQSALAEADLEGSQSAFVEAERLLTEARADVDEAVAAAQVVLKYVDVTGRVRSGDALLTAGQELTGAGKRIVQGLQYMQGGAQSVVGPELLGEGGQQEGATLVDGISAAQGEFEAALEHLVVADEALQEVKLSAVPEEIRGQVEQLAVIVPRLRAGFSALTAQSDTILYLLGAEQDRQYLLAFANNHELRPVGGFIGTVGLVNMDRGQVEQIDVGSVYHHDGQLRDFIAAPEPLRKIVDRWYMRDANWFVNYPVSARKMAEFMEKEGGPTVDGVVVMTPEVIERLLRLTGPVLVPGYDVVVSADDFRAVAQSQVTYEYDPELNRPKQFLADLTPLLLQKVLKGPEGGAGEARAQVQLLATLTEAISHKELLMYFRDEEAQASLADLGWDGSLPPEKQGFLSVNTANIGGHKSDQFVEQEIDYRSVLQADGGVEVTVTIRREHNGPTEGLDIEYPEGENPAEKDNVVWQRVFVPKGAQLLEASGFTLESEVPQRVEIAGDLPLRVDPEIAAWEGSQQESEGGTVVGQEAGYAYFANWLVTKPGQTTVGLYRYRLEAQALPGWWDRASAYQAYVYKQPGDDRTTVRASIEVPSGYTIAHTVPDTGVTREGSGVVYRGELRRDVVVGAVIEPGK